MDLLFLLDPANTPAKVSAVLIGDVLNDRPVEEGLAGVIDPRACFRHGDSPKKRQAACVGYLNSPAHKRFDADCHVFN